MRKKEEGVSVVTIGKRERRWRGRAYLDHLVIDARLLDEREKRHLIAKLTHAAEAQVERVVVCELTKASIVQDLGDVVLLLLREARAHEDSGGELTERVDGGLGSVWLVGVRLAQQVDERLKRGIDAVVEVIALLEKDVLVREPRELVQRGDEALVGADHAALSERRLKNSRSA